MRNNKILVASHLQAFIWVGMIFFLTAGELSAQQAASNLPDSVERMTYLENEFIKIGANLDLGGAITYLSDPNKEENLVNNSDWGRQIQMSFYSGPNPFEPNG